MLSKKAGDLALLHNTNLIVHHDNTQFLAIMDNDIDMINIVDYEVGCKETVNMDHCNTWFKKGRPGQDNQRGVALSEQVLEGGYPNIYGARMSPHI